MQQISDYELELMRVIWGNGGTALYAGIVLALEAKGLCWTKNTIITLLSRLIDKGLLKTNKFGRKNIYEAIVSEADYQHSQTRVFLDKLYEGNAKGLVAALLQKEMLSADDYEELKRDWERKKAEHE